MVKERLKCTVLSVSGYLLSPLSFWNDLFINFPIAYAFGLLFGFISRSLFLPGMIFGYWVSNVAGFVLLHKGILCMVNPNLKIRFSKSELIKDGILSSVYTVGLIILVKTGMLRFLPEYFR